MKIAVTYDKDNGTVFQHFGHSEAFKVYQVEDGDVVRGNFFVQIGAFSKKDNAQGLIERLTRSGQKGRMIFGSNNLWNVQVGPWEDSRKADEMMRVLRALYPHAFVVGDGGAS